jgi:ribonuclease T1
MRALWLALALSSSLSFARDCSLPDNGTVASDDDDPRASGRGRRRRRRDRDNANGQWAPPTVQPTVVQPTVQPMVVQPTVVQPTVQPTGVQPRVGAGARRLPFADPERVTEVNRTLDLIASGGPFPFRQDGVVFQNREGRLPPRDRGYYHEYTVVTPGLTHRGARRIITGTPPETWYSDDHYRTFTVIDPRRY